MLSIAAQHATLGRRDLVQAVDQDEEVDRLKLAREYIERSYDLVWNQHDSERAIRLLQGALEIQRECLGKHHTDVGWTCNFIGTGYWRMGAAKPALRYYFEARRIFCKSGRGKVKGIDNRIECVLRTLMGFGPDDVERYQGALRRMIVHELQGDRLQKDGFHAEASEEYEKARESSAILKAIL
jgi:Tetratricopeptide repeat